MTGMTDIQDVDRIIEVMSIANTDLIKDSTNLVLMQSAQVPPIVIPIHFEGPPALENHVDRPVIDVNIDMGE